MSSSDSVNTDIVIVGGRIAGASLAIQLARAGLSVLLVDRAKFPSDTLSTHLIQISGVRCMQQLGVLDALVSTGAPFLTKMRPLYDGIDLDTLVQTHQGWPPGGISINRTLLDKFLVDAATAEGVDVRVRTSVTGLRKDGTGRVSGVEITSAGVQQVVFTKLLIGADGRNSAVSRLVGARTYNTTANQRFVYWADFEGVVEDGPAAVHHYRHGPDLTLAFRSDSDRFTVMVSPGLEQFPAFKKRLPDSYDEAVAACEPLQPMLATARRATRLTGTAYVPGYFRESAGPGWALVGDSGHFKDPTVGQGISDALRQAEMMTKHLREVDVNDYKAVDRAMKRWWKWRDRDAAPMYWLAWDIAKAGPMEPLDREMLRCIADSDVLRQRFIDDVLSHRLSPYAVLTPGLMLRAARRLHRSGEFTLPQALVAVGKRIGLEITRQWLLRRPRFEPLPKPAGGAMAAASSGGEVWAGDLGENDEHRGACIDDDRGVSELRPGRSGVPGKPVREVPRTAR